MVFNNLKDVFFNSKYSVGKGMATYDNSLNKLLFESFPDLKSISNNEIAMDSISDSKITMEGLTDSKVAMQTLSASQISMDKIVNKQDAMNIIGNKDMAMESMLETQIAMDEISKSQIASKKFGKKIDYTKKLMTNTNFRNQIVGDPGMMKNVIFKDENWIKGLFRDFDYFPGYNKTVSFLSSGGVQFSNAGPHSYSLNLYTRDKIDFTNKNKLYLDSIVSAPSVPGYSYMYADFKVYIGSQEVLKIYADSRYTATISGLKEIDVSAFTGLQDIRFNFDLLQTDRTPARYVTIKSLYLS